jgi:hypothetical protein
MPYPNEHAARIRSVGDFSKVFRRTKGGRIYGRIKVPASIGIIWGKLKGRDKPTDMPIPQALRFDKKVWTVAGAKKWLKDHNIKYKRFEPAKKTAKAGADEEDTLELYKDEQGINLEKLVLTINGSRLAILPDGEG